MLKGLVILFGYIGLAASAAAALNSAGKIPGEVMRKILHMITVISVFIYVYAFESWYMAAAAAAIFAAAAYPAIMVVERFPKLMAMFNERSNGEIRMSLLIIHAIFVLFICVFWGLLGDEWKYIIIAAVLTWGIGDAAAALVGKRWGKRRLKHRWARKDKTAEGSLAMCIASAVTLTVTIGLLSGKPFYVALIIAATVAPMVTFVEMISDGKIDSATVPISAAFFVALLMFVFS